MLFNPSDSFLKHKYLDANALDFNNIVEELYYKYTESDLLEMLYEEYKKTGKILVLDEEMLKKLKLSLY